MSMDRRTFVERTAALFASAALPGVASVAATRVTPSGGAVRSAIRKFPQRVQNGGDLKIRPEGAATSIYVM